MTRRPTTVAWTAAAVVAALLAVTGVTMLRRTGGDTGPTADPPPATVDEALPPSTSDPAQPSVSAVPSAAPSASRSATPSTAPTTKAPPTTKAAAQVAAGNLASRLTTIPTATRQVIIVHAPGFDSTTATLETFSRTASGWQPAFGAMSARVGAKGFADRKHEGDLTTPTGVYSIGGTMYGIAANPGVRYGYHQLVADDYWNENAATPGYNTFVHGPDPGGPSEALWQITPQYDHFAVINYNVPVQPADPPRGSGIFLHVSAGRPTAGCVALSQADLVTVLKWLDPAAAPRIVLAPDSALGRY